MENENNTNTVANSGENVEKQHSIDNEKTQSSTTATTTSATFPIEKGDNKNVTVNNICQQLTKSQSLNNNMNTTVDSLGVNSCETMENTEMLIDDHKIEAVENDTQILIFEEPIVASLSTDQMQQVEDGLSNNPLTNTTTLTTNCNTDVNVTISNTSTTTAVLSPATSSPSIRYTDLMEKVDGVSVEDKDTTMPVQPLPVAPQMPQPLSHNQEELQENVRKECDVKLQRQQQHYEQQLEQLQAALGQKDNMILLFQRENAILEKEKEAVRMRN